MLGITPFGLFHTMISLVALAAGTVALLRYREIGLGSLSGRTFVGFTIASCVTGLFIFHHGGFGKPHVLAIVTLVTLAIATVTERKPVLGRWTRLASVLLYSLSFFLHFIPGFTETLTRVPVGHPWASGPDDPRLMLLISAAFVVFLFGGFLQARRFATRGSSLQVAKNPS